MIRHLRGAHHWVDAGDKEPDPELTLRKLKVSEEEGVVNKQ